MSDTIALVVSYDGSGYHGFQHQGDQLPTIQRELEAALPRISGHETRIVCSGRTDTGVHATHQVVHFRAEFPRPDRAWVRGTNRYLPDDIAIRWAGIVPEDFSARFTATERRYFYLIHNTPTRSPHLRSGITHEWRPLDTDAMAEAGQALIGEHDFTSYRAATCGARTPFREVRALNVWRKESVVVIDVAANAFLHHMVRNIAAVLIEIGVGRRPVGWAKELLERRDRAAGGPTARPNGLYLVDVTYPDSLPIPRGPDLPHLFSALLN